MSIENAKKFVDKLLFDKAFSKKIDETSSESEWTQVVQDAGLTFTMEELYQVKQILDQAKAELSLDELDQVSGSGMDDDGTKTPEIGWEGIKKAGEIEWDQIKEFGTGMGNTAKKVWDALTRPGKPIELPTPLPSLFDTIPGVRSSFPR